MQTKRTKNTVKKRCILFVLSTIGIAILISCVVIFTTHGQSETHLLSLKAYISDENTTKVSIGDIIKLALYYVPGKNAESGLQTSIKYSEGVTPIYENEKILVDTDDMTTYTGVDDLQSRHGVDESNWVIMAHDVEKQRTVNFIGFDFSGKTALDHPGTLAYIYFKVNQDAPALLKFTFNEAKTKINNNRPCETTNLTLRVER